MPLSIVDIMNFTNYFSVLSPISLTYRFKQGEKVEQPKRKKDNNNNYQGDDEQGPI